MILPADTTYSDVSTSTSSTATQFSTKLPPQHWIDSRRLLCLIVPSFLVLLFVVVFIRLLRPESLHNYATFGCQTTSFRAFKLLHLSKMPPVRGPLNTKGLKTERTHEENQERSVVCSICHKIQRTNLSEEPILPLLGAATAVWRRALNLLAELLKSTRNALAVLCESPSRMLSMRRCTRRKMTTCSRSTDVCRLI